MNWRPFKKREIGGVRIPPPLKIEQPEEVFLSWPDTFRRVLAAEKAIFTLADDATIYGIDPVGSVFAAIMVTNSKRLNMATDPEEADALLIGFSGTVADDWDKAFPEKAVVAMIDKRDPGFVDTWIVLPWEVHHTIQTADIKPER